MPQQYIQPVTDDGEILSSSPLLILDTKYYEVWLQIDGNPNWAQYIIDSPLQILAVTTSPVTHVPCIVIEPLPDNTKYNYQIRRFNSNNQASAWDTGSFTTGS